MQHVRLVRPHAWFSATARPPAAGRQNRRPPTKRYPLPGYQRVFVCSWHGPFTQYFKGQVSFSTLPTGSICRLLFSFSLHLLNQFGPSIWSINLVLRVLHACCSVKICVDDGDVGVRPVEGQELVRGFPAHGVMLRQGHGRPAGDPADKGVQPDLKIGVGVG